MRVQLPHYERGSFGGIGRPIVKYRDTLRSSVRKTMAAMDMGIPMGMGMGTVMNPHGPVGILWGFLNGCEIKWKRVKHVINVVVDI